MSRRPRIAAITMVGQFPDGIPSHVRNLRWALGPDDRGYVFTQPPNLPAADGVADDRVACVACEPAYTNPRGMVNFWREFPALLDRYGIAPEWYLFMQQDIWLTRPPALPADPLTIHALLPHGHYHNIMIGEREHHPRVWEGAQLVHHGLVDEALAAGVDFSFVPETFIDRDRASAEARWGGPIWLSDFGKADTFDEFGLYCALVAGTRSRHVRGAVHLRGPEVLHRRFPDLYRGGDAGRVAAAQAQLPYLDVLLAIATYHIVGLWPTVDHLDWGRLWPGSAATLDAAWQSSGEWLPADARRRFDALRALLAESPQRAAS